MAPRQLGSTAPSRHGGEEADPGVMGFYYPKVQHLHKQVGGQRGRWFPRSGCSCNAQSILSLPGGWLKTERSFYLKKRRADFVAGYLKGRVVVAGGLGEALGMAVTL